VVLAKRVTDAAHRVVVVEAAIVGQPPDNVDQARQFRPAVPAGLGAGLSIGFTESKPSRLGASRSAW
jgi:hypothetical protein